MPAIVPAVTAAVVTTMTAPVATATAVPTTAPAASRSILWKASQGHHSQNSARCFDQIASHGRVSWYERKVLATCIPYGHDHSGSSTATRILQTCNAGRKASLKGCPLGGAQQIAAVELSVRIESALRSRVGECSGIDECRDDQGPVR
jgi:hypothetical protein